MRRWFAPAMALCFASGCILFTDLGSFSEEGSDPADGATDDVATGAEGGAVDGGVDTSVATDAPIDDGAPPNDAPTDTFKPCNTPLTAGPRNGTIAIVSGSGVSWSNPTNAQNAADGVGAATALTVASDESAYLVVRGFGFNLPATATIRGIGITVTHRGTLDIRDREIRLAPNGTPSGENKEDADWPAAYSSYSYGGPTSLWQLQLTSAMVSAASFGVAIMARYDALTGSGTAEVDAVTMTVTYCE